MVETVFNRSLEKEINIYVGMTEMQRKWYRSVLEKDIDAVNGMSLDYFPLVSFLNGTPPCRPDGEERRQDPFNEHGHAGKEFETLLHHL